jgi:bla regulator protein blaR1
MSGSIAAELLRTLVMVTLASSLALLLVGVLRLPLRRIAGARAAYWLWLLVPALTLAVLIPAPSRVLMSPAAALPAQIQSLLLVVDPAAPGHTRWQPLVLVLWLTGAAAMFVSLMTRQRAFSRALGDPVRHARGWFTADVDAPMLVGLWRPRIVVPADFEARYTTDEQHLVLAHESAHARRRDVPVNALASLGLCFAWFNPLAYRALAWLRVDQELACDAVVLASRGNARQAYANALLKTQLAAESAWRMPLVCQWQSNHPLKERILMLKQPLPGSLRRAGGVALVLGIAAVSGYAAWAGQTAAPDQGPPILVDLKVTISNPQANEMHVLATRYMVHSGEEIRDRNAQPLDYACTPYLPDAPDRITDWSALQARGLPVPPAGQILLVCSIRQDGEEVSSPAVMMADGKPGAIETAEKNGPRRYRLDITASTSAARLAEAKEQERQQ